MVSHYITHQTAFTQFIGKGASFVLALFLFFLVGLTHALAQANPDYDRDYSEISFPETPPSSLEGGVEMMSSQSGGGGATVEAGTAYIQDVGLIGYSPQVNIQSGGMEYSYELKVPPGRNNFSPQLTLRYNSNDGRNNSPFGYGWNVSIPSIMRVNKTGIQNLYTGDLFESSLDGELVKVNTTTYVPKVDSGSFRTYEYSNNAWTVTEKDGAKYFFGSTTQARQDDPSDSSKVYTWMLEETRDTNSNTIKYSYYKHTGTIYPDQITYTGNGTTTGNFTVTFNRQSRSDVHLSNVAGFSATTSYRIADVTASINGTWVKKYTLAYTTGHNGVRSMLSSVTEESRDESLLTSTLPPVSFTYENYGTTSKSWEDKTSTWTIPEDFIRDFVNYDDGVRLIDVNGDGLMDIIRSWEARLNTYFGFTPQQRIHLNTGSGWATTTAWTLPDPAPGRMAFVGFEPMNLNNIELGVRFADVNGDGYTDILWGYYINAPGHPYGYSFDLNYVYLNNKVNGWATSTEYTLPLYFVANNKDNGVVIADINGDNLPDLLESTRSVTNNVETLVKNVYLNTGSGWSQASSSWNIPVPFVDEGSDAGVMVVDVNGDGLSDMVRHVDSDYNTQTLVIKKTYLNTGAGWQEAGDNWDAPLPFVTKLSQYGILHNATKVVDINGDGLVDFFNWSQGPNASSSAIYINNGSGWVLSTSQWSNFLPTMLTYTNNGLWSSDMGVRLFDVDGDNMLDFAKSGPNFTYPTNSHGKQVMIHKGSVPDILTKVTQPEGGTTTVGYTQTALLRDTNGNTLNPKLPYILNVVSTTTLDSLKSPQYSKTFVYAGGVPYYASSTDRQFAGFASSTETNAQGHKTVTYRHQANGTTSSEEYADHRAKIGNVYRVDALDSQNNVYQRTVTKWDTASTATSSAFVYKSRELTRAYDGDGDTKDSGAEYVFNTSNGNLAQQIEWGEVSGNTDGTFSDTGSDKRITQYGYATNTTDYIVGLPSSEVILDQSGNKVRESRYYYDSSSLGTVTKGNRTKEEGWITGSTYSSGTKAYNSYGLVTSETDPRGKTTTYTYDTYNLYPATSTNPLSQSIKYTYDYSSGKVATNTDPDGEVSVVVYDGLDRPRLERGSDPQTGALVTKNEYVYTDTSGSVSVKKIAYLNGATTSTAYVYQDGFGRTIQERKEVEDSNTYAVKDYVYGQDGLLTKESLSYTSTGASSTASTSVTNLYTLYAYDALGRVKSATTSVGTTRTSRDQWTETVTDALGKVKDYVYDAYGRLSQVKEYNSTSTYTTTYTWDHNNNLTKITDALGNVRNITYDGLGRRITLEDLHNPSDTSFGSWSFTYDLAGNLATTTNPKGQIIGYSYDSLNRPLTENYTGQAGTEVTYSYDSCTEGVGRLCTAVNSGATTTYTYTNTGAPKTEVKTIGGTAYTTAFEYDYQGNQTLVTYPDSSVVRYTYNKGNQLERVEQKESGGSYRDIITDFDYGPHGMVTYQLHGNGASTTKTYDADALYRLTRILTTASSTYGTGGPGDELLLLETELGLADEQLTPLTTEESLVTEAVTVPEETAIPVSESTTTEEVPINLTSEEVTPTITEVVGTTTEVTLPVTVEDVTAPLATTTEEVTPTTTPISEALATTTDMVEVLVKEVVATTTELVPEELKPTKRETEKLITSSHEARVWKKFHEERVAGLRNTKDAPEGALESALYAQDQFESFLLEKGYTKAKGEKVKTSAQEFILSAIKTVVDEVVSFILPDFAYAYLFGKEDFESCSSLPCSFSTHATWGSVTGSLDSTGKAVGQDSYKTVVSGEGSASLESVNYSRDEIWVQFKVFIPSNITWGASDYFSMLRLEDSSNGTIFWLSVENWGTARLTMSGDTLSWTDTGLNLTKGATNTVEVRFKKGASTGDVDIWLNNTTQGSPSYNGSGTLNTGTDNVDDVLIGMQYAPETGISTLYFDDMTIDSAFIGTASGGGGGPTGSFVEKVQDLSYTYDAVGNVTQIVDRSSTLSQATTSYEYDDLYRLTRASTTQASTTPYLRTYTYNALGNIMTASDLGAYTYGGDAGGGGESTYAIYGDSVTAGWSDWSWWVSLNPSNASPVAVGTYSLKVTYSGAWAGMAYHTSSFDSSPYDTLRFRVNVATSTATDLYVYFLDSLGAPIQVVTLESYVPGGFQANTWHTVEIPLSDLDFENYSGATDLAIEASGASVIYYDQIELVGTGGGSSNYANPHAVTAINGVTHAYDTNGNLASTTAGLTNTWDYLNRLTQSQGGGTATTTYLYDHTGQRTQKVANSITTKYPNQYYEVKGSTTTKHIYAGDALVATVQSDTPAPTIFHNHLDHLGSTNVTTDEDSYLNSVFSYYPYGVTRVDTQYGELTQSHQFTGHTYDEETDLTYAGARYLNTNIGKWISMDPASRDNPNQFLRDPQQFNSYSYARNNPLILIDPDGEKVELVAKPIFGVGNHLFYRVTPDNPESISINGLPAGTTEFTLGAYNPDHNNPLNNRLVKGMGCDGCDSKSTDFGVQGRDSVTINAPNNMSDTDFINSLGSAYNNASDGQNYVLTGPGGNGYSNSNNFVYDIGSQVGVGNQVSSFNPTGWTPGNNRSLATPNQPSRYQQTLSSIQQTLSRISDILKKKEKN